MNRFFAFLLLLAASSVLFQCVPKSGKTAAPTASKSADLDGLWVLQRIENSTLAARKGAFIKLQPGNYYLYAGCNHFNGGLKIKGDSIAFERGMSTLMACTDGDYERAFSALLFSVKTHRLAAGGLELTAEKGEILHFKRQLPAEHLVGKTFEVRGLNINNGIQSSVDQPLQTITFGTDGSLSGTAGCNNYSATYKIAGDTLQIGPAMSTKMACAEKAKREWEAAFFENLRKSPLRIEDSPSSVTLRDFGGATAMTLDEKK